MRLGPQPILLPEPLAGLMPELVRDRRRYHVAGEASATRWLFPGELPGRPHQRQTTRRTTTPTRPAPGQARSTALFQLATELPAAVLARTLGIHTGSAAAWQRASNGDWAAYATQISRQPNHHPSGDPR